MTCSYRQSTGYHSFWRTPPNEHTDSQFRALGHHRPGGVPSRSKQILPVQTMLHGADPSREGRQKSEISALGTRCLGNRPMTEQSFTELTQGGGPEGHFSTHHTQGATSPTGSAPSDSSGRPGGCASRSRSTPKRDLPETNKQAQVWETVKNRYLRLGLCHRCTSQAAWAHQIGWTRIEHDPCLNCLPLVQHLPLPTANAAWRSAPRTQALPRTTTPEEGF